jgi:YidC/Oxa1 family membrane protein insertase
MNIFALLWMEIVKRPMFNILIVLLASFGWNLGIAIIWLTLIVRLLLVKNAVAASDMQKGMSDMQPKMQEIQEKYKDQPEKMSAEMMALFKKSGGGPLKWCLSMLVQIPVFLWLYWTVSDIAAGNNPAEVYSFLQFLSVDITTIQTTFLGVDLLTWGNVFISALAWLLMYMQMSFMTLIKGPTQAPKIPWMNTPWMPDMSGMMKYMNVFFVFMMVVFVRWNASAIGLYIITTTAFGVIQQTRQYKGLLKAKWDIWRGRPEVIEG